jgi:pilus assembly protein CpaC
MHSLAFKKSGRIVRAVLAGLLAWSARPAAAALPATAPAPQSAVDPESITVYTGRSTLMQTSMPIKQISVADPKTADIQSLSPTQVLVSGKSVGTTDLIIWGDGQRARQVSVIVSVDRAAVRNEIAQLVPGADIDVRVSNDVLVVSGRLARAEQVAALHKYLEIAQIKYVDMTTLPGPQQVQIKVMVAEASRSAIRTLGVNAFQTGKGFFGASTIGPDGGAPLNPVNIGVPGGASVATTPLPFSFLSPTNVSPAASLFVGFPHANLEVFVQALAENQYLRVLAEPSLVALSGQDASFLAGGEFPIPVVQGGFGATGTSISIEYKEFGVRLRFHPTILGDGRIRLHVAPEVSDLSTGVGSVQIQGFSIPAILTRRAETTMELSSGQTFALAGLISQNTQARSSRVPGLGDLPVIGAMFRSVRYQEGDTELLLMVTASLVEPLNSDRTPPVPGGSHVPPNDWDLYAAGRVAGKTAGKLSSADAEWLRKAGLNRLRGPGAWAGYGAPDATVPGSK